MKGVGFKLPVINQKFSDRTCRSQHAPELLGSSSLITDALRGPSGPLAFLVLVRSTFCKPEKRTREKLIQ